VAKFDPRKNHRFFLNAVEQLFDLDLNCKQTDIYIVGDIGYRSFGKEIVKYGGEIEKSTHKIHFEGAVPDNALWKYYSSCDLLVMPSMDEGFGLPVLEALAFGLPCLVSNKGALPEIGKDFVYYSNIDTPNSFALQMREILNDKTVAFSRASHGQEYVNKVFSFERAMEQCEQIVKLLF
jgi:glycosyltransferase involved in cell wall biosynthesis